MCGFAAEISFCRKNHVATVWKLCDLYRATAIDPLGFEVLLHDCAELIGPHDHWGADGLSGVESAIA